MHAHSAFVHFVVVSYSTQQAESLPRLNHCHFHGHNLSFQLTFTGNSEQNTTLFCFGPSPKSSDSILITVT